MDKPGTVPGKAWNETETPFAKAVLEFVNSETYGSVAWFSKDPNGNWTTLVQVTSWAFHPLAADSEIELAKRYWTFHYRRVQNKAQRLSTIWHFFFSHSKQIEARAQLKRWNEWRAKNFPE